MKKPLTLLISLSTFLSVVYSQPATYWQQQVNFKIDVSLNDKENTLDAFEKVQYTNNSPDTLNYIWFHLWPNAYKNDRTALSEQLLELRRTDFYFSNREDRGYINRLDFRIHEQSLKTEDHPNYIDVIKVILPQPLAPGSSVEITTPFHVKLPKNFSRGGHTGQSYQITQWFPKPAVYDSKGWHPMPYLDQGEFYSEYGNYEVRITVPQNYVVAATGDLQNEEEKKWLLNRTGDTASTNEIKAKNVPNKKTAVKTKKPITKSVKPSPPVTTAPKTDAITLKTLIYKQNNVHDFAWFADKRYAVMHDTIQLPSGKVVEAFLYCFNKDIKYWKNGIQFIKQTIQSRSQWIGEYPYNSISVVEAKMGFEGGMEYPTITSISPTFNDEELESLIEHEVGHNWFQGIIGNNEREHMWMDEGINSYYDGRYYREIKKQEDEQKLKERLLAITEAEKKDQPIETNAEAFTSLNNDLIGYYKADKWMRLLEKELGRDAFDKAMQQYFHQWQYKHPYPEDLKKILETSSNKNLDQPFSLLNQTGPLPTEKNNKTSLVLLPPSVKTVNAILRSRNKLIFFSPLAGYNTYDQLMIGAGITNYLPPTGRFRFLLAPLYSTGAKTISGLARISYRWFPETTFKQIEIFTAASKFTTFNFTDDYKEKVNTGFTKIVPGIRFTFKENDPKSTVRKYIQWKTFFINEDELRFRRDSVITQGSPPDTAVLNKAYTQAAFRYINQLKLVIENNRVLYPYHATLQIDQGNHFIRTAITGNYYFNYQKKGGFDLRFFAGKFFYTGTKAANPFETYPYHFNMSGARGSDDYTYSDYFIGRSEQLFWRSQQIAIRDGGFKVGTELLSDRVGRTDDWLIATNLTTTIPDNINPLSILPVKIPLKAFLDIGTYADAWKKEAEGTKFLFDAGLQLSLFRNTFNIYVPLLYSKVYSDYFKSYKPDTKFLRNISFSIDLQNIRLPEPLRNTLF